MMRGKLSDAGRTGLKASAAIPNIRWTLISGLIGFFAFFEKPLTLAKLGRLDVRDFRAYLASRAAKHLEKVPSPAKFRLSKTFSNGWTATILLKSGNQRHIFAAEVKNSAQGAGYGRRF